MRTWLPLTLSQTNSMANGTIRSSREKRKRVSRDSAEVVQVILRRPLTRKSFAGRKGFFFAKSSRSLRLRGESWAGPSPRRRETREENAKDFSLVAALLP